MIKALAAGILTVTVVLSATLAVGFVVTAPLDASAAAQDLIAERVDRAFADATGTSSPTVLTYREAAPVDCAAAVWPHIDPSCLTNGNETSAGPVRIVY